MTIEELNKIIQEELKAYLNENEEEVDAPEGDGDDDIEVTTDEPAEDGDDALGTLKQIYDMLKPLVEPEVEEEPVEDEEPAEEEGEEEPVEDEEEVVDEAIDNHTHFRADNANRVNPQAKDVQGRREKVNESVARFKKLANING